MDNKAGRVLKEVLFYSITIGLGFHLHYQIMGGAKESAKQEQKQENNVAYPRRQDHAKSGRHRRQEQRPKNVDRAAFARLSHASQVLFAHHGTACKAF